MAHPTLSHWKAAKGVLHYLAGTSDYALVLGGESVDEGLVCFGDADYGGCVDTRRSTTGYVVTLHGGLVSWSSKLQKSIATSTMHAEYVAAAEVAKEALWLRQLLTDLGYELESTPINCDSQCAIQNIRNPRVTDRSKHIEIRYHMIRETVASGAVTMYDCRTDEMVADVMTKPLPVERFRKHRLGMGVRKI